MRSYKINPQSEKEFFDCISDIYFTDEVQGLAVYEQHLDINRLQHITSVAYLSYLICKKWVGIMFPLQEEQFSMTFSIMTGMKRTPPTGFTVTAIPVLPLKTQKCFAGINSPTLRER